MYNALDSDVYFDGFSGQSAVYNFDTTGIFLPVANQPVYGDRYISDLSELDSLVPGLPYTYTQNIGIGVPEVLTTFRDDCTLHIYGIFTPSCLAQIESYGYEIKRKKYSLKKRETDDIEDFVPVSSDVPDRSTYSGSGSLILAKFDGDSRVYVVMFKFTDNMWGDAGGGWDDGSTVFGNATKETREESRYLFNIQSRSPDFIDVRQSRTGKKYRCFVYKARFTSTGELKARYFENKDTMDSKHHTLDVYNETDDITFDVLDVMCDDINTHPTAYKPRFKNIMRSVCADLDKYKRGSFKKWEYDKPRGYHRYSSD